MRWKTKEGGWNPYLAGALTGLLAIASVVATTQTGRTAFLGSSTTFVRAAAYIERFFSPAVTEAHAYYAKTRPVMDWQFMLVIGIFLGALASSFMDRSFKLERVPPVWEERFGASVGKRAAAAVVGGVVAMIGARLADGCTSGHGLSGMMQLSVSGFAALVAFFGAGVVTARLLYDRRKS
jgi:uncharacterized protein